MASSSSGASSSETTASGLADHFGNLVIGVSGNIPGRRQRDIKRLVERHGGRFEEAGVSNDCTHLITTQRHINTKKVREARDKENCDIVSIDWLIASLQKLKPVSTKDFLLTLPDRDSAEAGTSIGGAQVSEKRKLVSELEGGRDGPLKKLRIIPPNEYDKWAAIVEEDFQVQQQKLIVWKDDEGIWDASLVKEVSAKDSFFGSSITTSFYRFQLLFNVKERKYYTHIRRDPSGKQMRYEVKGTGDLEAAQNEFRKIFKRSTGLQWENRTDFPRDGRGILVACSYEDEVANGSSPAQSKSASSAGVLSEPVREFLSMLFNPKQKPAIQGVLQRLSAGRLKVNRTQVTKHTVRIGTALLDMLCKLPRKSNGELNADDGKIADRLTRCYIGLMFDIGNQALDATWIQQERDTLCFLRNLIWIVKALDDSPRMSSKLLSEAHQKLCFPTMIPLKTGTNEYKLVNKYFQACAAGYPSNSGVFNIFRIERTGEKDQLEKWTAANQAKAGERRLLWHGSSLHNFLGILSQGLRMNAFPMTPGRMFDTGIYFADMSTKSVRYCRAHSRMKALLLLCEVEVGHTMTTYTQAAYNAGSAIKMSNSCAVMGEGSITHRQWRDAGCVHPDLQGILMPDVDAGIIKGGSACLINNEYVVYDPAQVRQRYLVQFQMP